MVPEFSILDELNLYPTTKKFVIQKLGESNPSIRIGIARVEGAGKKWIKKHMLKMIILPGWNGLMKIK